MGKKQKILKPPKKLRHKRILPNVDYSSIKAQIKRELYLSPKSSGISEKNHLITNSEMTDEKNNYFNRYSNYMMEEFNPRLVNMMILYVQKKDFPLYLKNEENFMNKIISLIKHLLMNELEVATFTLLIDIAGWKYKDLDSWTYFCILGIYVKQIVTSEEESSFLLDRVSATNPRFYDQYSDWINDDAICNQIQENNIDFKRINERFKELTKPVNIFCRKDFIDYNGVVDKIVKLSQPYGQESNGNKMKENELWELKTGEKVNPLTKENKNFEDNKILINGTDANLYLKEQTLNRPSLIIAANTSLDRDPFRTVFLPSEPIIAQSGVSLHPVGLDYNSRFGSRYSLGAGDCIFKQQSFSAFQSQSFH